MHEYEPFAGGGGPPTLAAATDPHLEVFLDGSADPVEKVAAWGFLIVANVPLHLGQVVETIDAQHFIVYKRCGRVVTDPGSAKYVGATRETNNTGELTAFVEAMLFVLFESSLAAEFSITFVFDSLLSGSQTMGRWGISDDSVSAELARTAHALWTALNPQHAPIFGRWVRAHAGNRFNERVDELAKLGLWRERAQRRVYWRDVEGAVAALGDAHARIRPQLLDLPAPAIYDMITDAHQRVATAIREQVPKAQPRRPWFDTHCMRLVDRRNEARRDGASEDEIQSIAREIGRACRQAKRLSH